MGNQRTPCNINPGCTGRLYSRHCLTKSMKRKRGKTLARLRANKSIRLEPPRHVDAAHDHVSRRAEVERSVLVGVVTRLFALLRITVKLGITARVVKTCILHSLPHSSRLSPRSPPCTSNRRRRLTLTSKAIYHRFFHRTRRTSRPVAVA